jgi:5S rRNA maturation endonuclease (ribonuclease M5)
MDDKQYFSEKQIRTYFTSINTELGYSNHGECAFLCPIHGDNTASASFNLDKQVWYCHACGIGGDLYEMEKHLCPDDPFPVIKERVIAICKGQARPEAVKVSFATKDLKEKKYRPVTNDVTYFYNAIIDEKEKHKYAITRYHYDDNPTEKTFRVWYAKDGKQVWGAPKDFPLIPYRLPELQTAQIVFIVEGEKCVDIFRKAIINDAITATCNPFGAGKWEDSYSKHLQDKVVVILPDNDEPGRKHAEQVAASAHQYAKLVKIGHVPLEAEGSDIADLIESIAGKQAEYTAEQKQAVLDAVMGILKKSKPWEPPTTIIKAPTMKVVDLPEDQNPPFPKDAMYGWCGDKAKQLETPLGWGYPAMLAVGSVMTPPVLPNIHSQLYVNNLGPSGGGKTQAIERAVATIAWEDGTVEWGVPGSDRGLYRMFKHDKPYPKPVLLAQDEIRNLIKSKIGIQGSALPYVLTELWSRDEAKGAVKDAIDKVPIQLSIVGAMKCDDSTEFKNIFGQGTLDGLSRRFIFGVAPSGWEFEPYSITPEPMMTPYSVQVPQDCWDMLKKWRNEKSGRSSMGELAMRVALITSFCNHDLEITPEAMEAAFRFMEWQEAIRGIYKAGDSETKDAEVEIIPLTVLQQLGAGVPTSWWTLYKNRHLDRKGSLLVNRVRDALVREGVIGFDRSTKTVWLLKEGQK